MSDSQPANESTQETLNDQIRQRYANLEAWKEDGIEPFGHRVDNVISATAANPSMWKTARSRRRSRLPVA